MVAGSYRGLTLFPPQLWIYLIQTHWQTDWSSVDKKIVSSFCLKTEREINILLSLNMTFKYLQARWESNGEVMSRLIKRLLNDTEHLPDV